jgi:CNT family concentrative nucleoside transporter
MKYLIAASFMAAPGGLLMAKLIVPETETVRTDLKEIEAAQEQPANVIDAAASGASNGMQLALNVGAMLLAFVALIAMLNGLFGLVGGWLGYPEFSIQQLLGYLFQPLAFVLGVPWNESHMAGSFIGQKMVVNEFVAYFDFMSVKEQLSHQSQAIITFALCGFANFSSIAILLGGIGGMAPSRRKDIARLGLKAMLAASLANFMSAAIAGFFISL